MKRMNLTMNMKLGMLAAMLQASAGVCTAETIDIRLSYKPGDFNLSNKFTIVSESTGDRACTQPGSKFCGDNERSFVTTVQGQKQVLNVNSDDIREKTGGRFNGNWKYFEMTSSDGKKIQARTRLTIMNWQQIVFTEHDMGSGNMLYQGPFKGECTKLRESGSKRYLDLTLSIKEGLFNTCYLGKQSNAGFLPVPSTARYVTIAVATEILSRPIDTENGVYTGAVPFSVGDNADIDLFSDSYSDNEIKINFTADVAHLFNVRFPATQNNITLSPKGGWDQWKNGGRVPQQLSNDVPFSLSTSTNFSVSMQCGVNIGEGCGLSNTANEQQVVPLSVALTMPSAALEGTPGTGTQNVLLKTSKSTVFTPANSTPVFDSLSKVSFVVGQDDVKTMLNFPNSTWKGTVSLIFDAEVE